MTDERPAGVSFEERGCQHWFRKHPLLRAAVERTVATQLAHGLFKSKFATSLRWRDQGIYECRVNEKSVGSVRVAFAVREGRATVLYVSRTLQKRAFTTELERFLRKAGCR